MIERQSCRHCRPTRHQFFRNSHTNQQFGLRATNSGSRKLGFGHGVDKFKLGLADYQLSAQRKQPLNMEEMRVKRGGLVRLAMAQNKLLHRSQLDRLAHVPLLGERQVANQMAAPAESRTPNLHRANEPLLESANGSLATVANSARRNTLSKKNEQPT
jgi:hypothetical protein